jgi:hypothetical protein
MAARLCFPSCWRKFKFNYCGPVLRKDEFLDRFQNPAAIFIFSKVFDRQTAP